MRFPQYQKIENRSNELIANKKEKMKNYKLNEAKKQIRE